jgi:hypothetical protein
LSRKGTGPGNHPAPVFVFGSDDKNGSGFAGGKALLFENYKIYPIKNQG